MPRKKKQPQENIELQEVETQESPTITMEDLDDQIQELERLTEENPQDLEETQEQPFEEPETEETEEMTEEPPEMEEENSVEDEMEKEVSRRADSMMRVNKARQLLSNAKDARRKFDREWLGRSLFYRGYQFTSQNPSTGSVSLSSMNRSLVPVNMTWAFVRSIKNQVTSFNPKWEVLPEFKGKQSEMNARLAGKLLDYLYGKSNLNKLIKEAVIQGLLFSIGGPFEVIWDPSYDNGPNQPRGEIRVLLHDPFDVYFDPIPGMNGPEYFIKAIRTSLSQVKTNQNYDKRVREKIMSGESKLAESEYKQFLLQTIHSGINATAQEDQDLMVYELQQKEYDEDGGIKIRYLTWCDETNEPLRDELVDQEDFDIEIFQADMNPGEIYGESWSRHVIALNRASNALESSMFDFNYRVAKGRLVIDKNSGIKAITNEHGTIIEKNRGAEVSSLPLAPLPSSVENQIIRLRNAMEDISGVHDASLGRVPSSVKSGIGIAELKQSDSTNQDDLVQNLEQCLMRLGQKILKKIAKHYDSPRIVRVVGTGRLVEHFAVVGKGYLTDENKESWKVNEEKYPLAKIGESNELKVQIGSWLAYSKEAQQKTLMDLAEAGLISQEQVLKYLEFPDVQEILDQTRAEKIIEMKRKEAPEMPMGISQEELARTENEMLQEGQPMPVDPELDDHELHIAIHQSIIDKYGDNRVVSDHIREHRRAQKGGGQALPMQTPPQPEMGVPQAPAAPPMIPPPAPLPGELPPGVAPGLPIPPPPAPPEASYFSAGVAELPPTAGSLLGGPVNTLPTL